MQLETADNEGNAGATRTKWCSGLRTGLFNPFRYFGDSALVRAAVREHQVGDDAGGGSTGQCAGDDGESLHRRAERGLAVAAVFEAFNVAALGLRFSVAALSATLPPSVLTGALSETASPSCS